MAGTVSKLSVLASALPTATDSRFGGYYRYDWVDLKWGTPVYPLTETGDSAGVGLVAEKYKLHDGTTLDMYTPMADCQQS